MTGLWRRGCSTRRSPSRRARGRNRTGPGCMPSCAVPASPCCCCGRSIEQGNRRDTATAVMLRPYLCYAPRSGFRTYRSSAFYRRNIIWCFGWRAFIPWRFAMYQTSCPSHATDDRPDEAPFADERGRYLRHYAEYGAKAAVLKVKLNELLWIATRLDLNARDGVDTVTLSRIAQERQGLHGAVTAARRVIDIGRPWLRFLGWWREPTVTLEHQDKLDQYVAWMRSERGFIPATVEHWSRTIGRFLRWCEHKNRELVGLTARDIDEYFVVEGVGRWCRVLVANTASALRGFLRFAASRGFCANGLAASISRPGFISRSLCPLIWCDRHAPGPRSSCACQRPADR